MANTYKNNGGIYTSEDRYEELFLKAYKNLTEMEQKIVIETKVNSDIRLYFDYMKIVSKIYKMIYEEDQDIAFLVYRKMLPNLTLESKEDIEAYEKSKKKVK